MRSGYTVLILLNFNIILNRFFSVFFLNKIFHNLKLKKKKKNRNYISNNNSLSLSLYIYIYIYFFPVPMRFVLKCRTHILCNDITIFVFKMSHLENIYFHFKKYTSHVPDVFLLCVHYSSSE